MVKFVVIDVFWHIMFYVACTAFVLTIFRKILKRWKLWSSLFGIGLFLTQAAIFYRSIMVTHPISVEYSKGNIIGASFCLLFFSVLLTCVCVAFRHEKYSSTTSDK